MRKILSVSVAAYNMENFIEECLNSFCMCKNLNLMEIIVNDNGSTDRTDQIVQLYVDQYPDVFHLIKRKVNGNYGAVLNTAMQIATGKYFKLVDGDDWVNAGALDHLIEVLKNTEADVVINNYRRVYPDHVDFVELQREHDCNTVYTFETIGRFQIYTMHGITVRLDKYKKEMIPISENKVYVDNEFVLQVFMAVDSFLFLKDDVYQHRVGRSEQFTSINAIYSYLDDVAFVGERLFYIYITANHKTWTKAKGKWLFNYMEKAYRWVLSWYTLVQKSDKDLRLQKFLIEVEQKYGNITKHFSLGVYRLLSINFGAGMRLIRTLKWIKYTYITKRGY